MSSSTLWEAQALLVWSHSSERNQHLYSGESYRRASLLGASLTPVSIFQAIEEKEQPLGSFFLLRCRAYIQSHNSALALKDVEETEEKVGQNSILQSSSLQQAEFILHQLRSLSSSPAVSFDEALRTHERIDKELHSKGSGRSFT